jgi:hypothetical protein
VADLDIDTVEQWFNRADDDFDLALLARDHVPSLVAEVRRLRSEMAAVVPLVRDLTDEDACWFDTTAAARLTATCRWSRARSARSRKPRSSSTRTLRRLTTVAERLTQDISADLRKTAEAARLRGQGWAASVALMIEASDKLDGLLESLLQAELDRDETLAERNAMQPVVDALAAWRASGVNSFDLDTMDAAKQRLFAAYETYATGKENGRG